MVRYYGYYSNKSRGVRKKDELVKNHEKQESGSASATTTIMKSDLARKKFRKNWARLIQKVYFVDPLLCPKCGGGMRIISFIEDDATNKKILLHLNLWLPQTHDPPQEERDHTTIPIHPNRSYEWWEAINQVSGNAYSEDTCMQSPYEDAYSQLESCAY